MRFVLLLMLALSTAAACSDDDSVDLTVQPGPPPVFTWNGKSVPIGGLTVRRCPMGCDASGCPNGDSVLAWRVSSTIGRCLVSPIRYGDVVPEAELDPSAPLASGTAYQVQVLSGCNGSQATYASACFVAK